MKIDGTHKIDAPREQIFDLLTNPLLLQKCIPGCEKMDNTAENQYAARLSVGVGPIKGVFNATVNLTELRRPDHYALTMEGKGQAGFVKGSGVLDFADDGGATMVHFTGDVNVGGLIASVGQRMIQSVGKMMAERFFVALENEAKAQQKASQAALLSDPPSSL
ncbi:MAG TPA: carbon monoxide dehydrogenase subunit G [Candidatus Angelobacter sp.]|nr:carbon monoxide dehydrogenase subunit G [Candidatus Angelobacter sp.]